MLPLLDQARSVSLTVRGRRTGKSHTVVVWFAHLDGCIYLLAHARSHGQGTDWYRNFLATGKAWIDIDGSPTPILLEAFDAPDRAVDESLALFRRKYGDAVDTWYAAGSRVAVKARICLDGLAFG